MPLPIVCQLTTQVLLALILLTAGGDAWATSVIPSQPATVSDDPEDEEGDTDAAKHGGGYLLLSPMGANEVQIIDREGTPIHTWQKERRSGSAVYLLDDGSLLRTGSSGARGAFGFQGGGAAGMIERVSWQGEVTWKLDWASQAQLQHHDIEPLPNGNLLLVTWERKTEEECLAVGRHEALLPQGQLWVDAIIEVKPTGKEGAEVVWRWSPWDHLVQDIDPEKPNYGKASEHPNKIDINYVSFSGRELGQSDWMHTNAVNYNPKLDQIILSVHGFDEVWIIDHSTQGDENPGILWRWGNPEAYGMGNSADRTLFKQHDARWIDPGNPGQGNIMIFNNGQGRPGSYSTVLELESPLKSDGSYRRNEKGSFEAANIVWKYENPGTFYSPNISGAVRLPGGNTLICSGANGEIFEVTRDGKVVWQHTIRTGSRENGAGMRGGGGRGGGIFRAPWISPDHPGLRPTEPQKKKPANATSL
ncbi:MAG: aryl-sulfate sulfotransferase [Planctomycetota bacterium]|nr:aryl-sulfate sulfotransferase [Planctomycetota bacterium]